MSKSNTKTILLVDDEEALRKAIAFDFKRKGYNVIEAGNGRDAYEVVASQNIDLVLTDVKMAGGDGIELLGRIRKMEANAPLVIFLTGFSEMPLEDAFANGIEAVFSKPFNRKNLMAAVEAALEKKNKATPRRHDRMGIDFTVQIETAEAGPEIMGRVVNIGRGGIFVALSDAFPEVNADVKFVITFHNRRGRQVNGSGIVRWVRKDGTPEKPAGCGIEFRELANSSRAEIVELINDLKTHTFEPK